MGGVGGERRSACLAEEVCALRALLKCCFIFCFAVADGTETRCLLRFTMYTRELRLICQLFGGQMSLAISTAHLAASIGPIHDAHTLQYTNLSAN